MKFTLPFPWQTTQWEHLSQCYQRKQLPHALLFSGIAGLGKQLFALAFSKAICCQNLQASHQACHQCKNCHLWEEGSYPEYYSLQPENESKIIRVDQIRELVEKLMQTAVHGSHKVVIIEPAEAMAVAAANALLKTLEEPNGDTLIILISSQAHLLPATIRSRCQTIRFMPPAKQEAMTWFQQQSEINMTNSLTLDLADGAPLRAITLVDSLEKRKKWIADLENVCEEKICPLQLAALLQKESSIEIINLLISITIDLARLKSGFSHNQIVNKDISDFLQKHSMVLALSQLFLFLDNLYQIKNELNTMISFNQQLLLENIFCKWHLLFQNCRSSN